VRRAARVDQTANALVKQARQLGAIVIPINGVVDALLFYRGQWRVVDWKSPGGTLTKAQAKLVAQGARIDFISTEGQLLDVLGVGRGSNP
jgi:choline dehydrogenase-like flavoprotein